MARSVSGRLRRLSQSIPRPPWPPFGPKTQTQEPVQSETPLDGSSHPDEPGPSQQMPVEQSILDEDAGPAIEETIQDLIDVPDISAIPQEPENTTLHTLPPGETDTPSNHISSQERLAVPTIIINDAPQSRAQKRQSRVTVDSQPKDKYHKQAPRPVIIEKKGLLTIIVGASRSAGPEALVVSLDLARRVSDMLAWTINQNAQTTRLTHKTLHLPHDSPKMLQQVMRIAHFQFDKVLDEISFPELVDLAQLSGRYGLNAFLMHYIPGWLEPHRRTLVREGYEEWLLVAYQFGREAEYRKLARHLAMVCAVDSTGNLLSPGVGGRIEGAFPPGSLDQIRRTRFATVTSIFRAVYGHIYSFTQSNQCEARLDSAIFTEEDAQRERSTCTFINQGVLRRTLDDIQFYPRAQVKQNGNLQIGYKVPACKDSINFLLGQLKSMEAIVARFTVDGKVNLPRDRHVGCDAGKKLVDRVVRFVEQVDDPVSESTTRELRKNGSLMKKEL
ncbi:hypothetical protein K491DRAFT_405138 [Lophiostoma macrostomum CBS 122681]|uniref:Uncharacterized protein n=1 Tax=Lophiostoma macrostomum CBS 122681 TaxID=1314788 RepID=A0A6A6T7X5_9PLEO|nr:hypothetical protein K491DRAFT_405138 [Lophiostoma macrostomum CBS 122681]